METVEIGGKKCHILQNGQRPCPAIYWGIGAEERANVSIQDFLGQDKPYLLIAYEVMDWSRCLTPWPAPDVLKKRNFSGEASITLDWLLHTCIPYIESHYGAGQPRQIGGYSLAGLFSLWAFYESGAFQGAASCSGSLWYPGWDAYMNGRSAPLNSFVYLSLGDKEERTKNQVMAKVGDATRKQYTLAEQDRNVACCTLEWNAGGHFKAPELRMAKGFQWLLTQA